MGCRYLGLQCLALKGLTVRSLLGLNERKKLMVAWGSQRATLSQYNTGNSYHQTFITELHMHAPLVAMVT